ncbi:hypothetical protein BN1708_013828 [Verticillium longisporum]|uniref:Uncharacterized protein n=1 Tax=Verticillium longisporum TaxID=100787 RepID=A0A0G4LPA1_VERLO|nr:hypothetical protein BN1708_013828 [Verticillium longisporum]
MASSHSGAATLPKGFRYHDTDSAEPKTPEPLPATADADHDQSLDSSMLQPPSPPRPRFKLKRRVISSFNAPTQQFLASVAAADVPVPSIEESATMASDENMTGMTYSDLAKTRCLDDLDMGNNIRGRTFSPPKTPAPGYAPSLSPRRYPNWSRDSAVTSEDDDDGDDSSAEWESSRPSTARSTHTSASLFSRYSITSDELQCASVVDPNDLGFRYQFEETSKSANAYSHTTSKASKMRKAAWTRPMSDHLWSTYLTYLQDPSITPVRNSKSGVPPQGVCARVARETKRSWRGPRPKSGAGTHTPTPDSSTYLQWPHTYAATRAHLRELCKLKASSHGMRASQYIKHSPTPFGRTATRFWNRRSTPTPSAFSSRDMVMSLTLSTAASMQPRGPLAQLTQSTPEPVAAPAAQSSTCGPRRGLQSPVKLARSRSNTQKRRSRQSSVEPRKTKRPSLASDFWTQPTEPLVDKVAYSSTNSHKLDKLFVPRTNLAELFPLSLGVNQSLPPPQPQFQRGLTAASNAPARLGSPFTTSSSFSFPNRYTKPDERNAAAASKPYATVQQPREAPNTTPPRGLVGRLAYLDERLKEFRRRDSRRRSESPF